MDMNEDKASEQWIRCSGSFYSILKKRIVKDKKALKKLKEKGDYFYTFKEATEAAAKQLRFR